MFLFTGDKAAVENGVAPAPRREDQALAFIMVRIMRQRASPTLREISKELGVSKSRVSALLDKLEAKGRIERTRGAQRSIVIRDGAHTREMFTHALDALGWGVNGALPHAPRPCPDEHLPRVPSIRYLDDRNDRGGI